GQRAAHHDLLGTDCPSPGRTLAGRGRSLKVDAPLPLGGDPSPAEIDDQAQEFQVDTVGRRTAWRFPSVIRAARGRARAADGRGTDCACSPAVGVARRACVPMSVVAGPARTELVDGAILAIIDR